MEPSVGRIGFGLACQTASIPACLFGILFSTYLWPSLGFLGIPLFGISVYLFMTSRAPLALRLAMSFWPSTMALLFALYIPAAGRIYDALQWRLMRTEVFLIPAEFAAGDDVEEVNITLDDPKGTPPEREGNNVVFRIPASGHLITRDHAASVADLDEVNQATDDSRQFYFVDKSGRRTRALQYEAGTVFAQPTVSWNTSHLGGAYRGYHLIVIPPAVLRER